MPAASGSGSSSMSRMRAPYRFIARLSQSTVHAITCAARGSGEVTKMRESVPWSASTRSYSIMLATPGWAIKCIASDDPAA